MKMEKEISPDECVHKVKAMKSLSNILQLEPCRRCLPEDREKCPSYKSYAQSLVDSQSNILEEDYQG